MQGGVKAGLVCGYDMPAAIIFFGPEDSEHISCIPA